MADTIVRCNDGHLFSTIWIPLISFKSIRLGAVRIQYCPVGKHWTRVRPVMEFEITEEERKEALARKDIRIP